MKLLITCAAAAIVVSPLLPTAAALSPVGAGIAVPNVAIAPNVTLKAAPNAALKGDRLDIGARGGACADQAWPYYGGGCLYDGLHPAGEVRKVRVVYTDRVSVE